MKTAGVATGVVRGARGGRSISPSAVFTARLRDRAESGSAAAGDVRPWLASSGQLQQRCPLGFRKIRPAWPVLARHAGSGVEGDGSSVASCRRLTKLGSAGESSRGLNADNAHYVKLTCGLSPPAVGSCPSGGRPRPPERRGQPMLWLCA